MRACVAVRHLTAAGATPAAIWRPRREKGHGGRHLRIGPPTRAAPIDANTIKCFSLKIRKHWSRQNVRRALFTLSEMINNHEDQRVNERKTLHNFTIVRVSSAGESRDQNHFDCIWSRNVAKLGSFQNSKFT